MAKASKPRNNWRRYLLGMYLGFRASHHGKGYGIIAVQRDVPFAATRRGWKLHQSLRHPLRSFRNWRAGRRITIYGHPFRKSELKSLRADPTHHRLTSTITVGEEMQRMQKKEERFAERHGFHDSGSGKAEALGTRVHLTVQEAASLKSAFTKAFPDFEVQLGIVTFAQTNPLDSRLSYAEVARVLEKIQENTRVAEEEQTHHLQINQPIGYCSGCGQPVYTRAGFCGNCHPHFS